jgi:hypothetical protein
LRGRIPGGNIARARVPWAKATGLNKEDVPGGRWWNASTDDLSLTLGLNLLGNKEE